MLELDACTPSRRRCAAPGRGRGAGHDRAVADATYKIPEDRWDQTDLSQLLAYCAALGLPSGLLLYASAQPLERQTVNRLGVHLEVVGIDLTRPPAQILAQAQRSASHLIEVAANQALRSAA